MRLEPLVCVAFLGLWACGPSPADDGSSVPDEPAPSGRAAAGEGADPAPAPTEDPMAGLPTAVADWWPEIATAAGHHGVPAELVALVVWLESNGDPGARSPRGALGLMQLMPATAAEVARARGEPPPTEDDLLDPERNLDLGCAHLAALSTALATAPLDDAGVHRLAVAYNGGTRVLAAWQRGEPLPPETERYAATLRERWLALVASPRE